MSEELKIDQVNALYEIADALLRMADAMERAHPPDQPNVDAGPLYTEADQKAKP